MYRFKTEKEFEKEFGSDWKTRVTHSWCDDGRMDHFLGSRVTKEQYHSTYWPLRIDNWSISKEMLKEDHLFPVFQRLKEVFL